MDKPLSKLIPVVDDKQEIISDRNQVILKTNAGDYAYFGAFHVNGRSSVDTFSVGIFKVVNRLKGYGKKAERIIFRLRAFYGTPDEDAVGDIAARICKALNERKPENREEVVSICRETLNSYNTTFHTDIEGITGSVNRAKDNQ